MLCCYFISRANPDIENLPNRTQAARNLSFVRGQDLIAAVRRWPAGARFTPQLMLEYNAVLAAASKVSCVLPLRFGSSFRGEAAILRLLAGRRRELLGALDRLQDKAEMDLRLRLSPNEGAHGTVAGLNEIYRPLDCWSEVRSNPAGERILEVAHLILGREAAAYRQRLADRPIEITGPWPPFHFLPQFLRMPVRAEHGSARAASAAAG